MHLAGCCWGGGAGPRTTSRCERASTLFPIAPPGCALPVAAHLGKCPVDEETG